MSSESERHSRVLIGERHALNVYLEALLREIPEDLPGEIPVAVPAPATVTPVPAPVASEQVAPRWGDGAFQAMLFKVCGLTLAVPLVELSGIQVWQAGKVTPLPNHVEWFLGLTPYRGRSVPVIDTAQLVLPENRRQVLAAPADRLQRVVFIDDGRWGLACDEVAEVLTLQPDQVRWRTSRTTRRWLAGTVIEHMCALIDPPAFAQMLATGIEDAGLESLEENA